MTLRWTCADFEIRADERVLLVGGKAASIGSRAFDVLVFLARNRDRVVTKEELLRGAWPGLVVEDNNLSVQITALRKLLGPSAISTVTGVGYRFTGRVDESQEATPGRVASEAGAPSGPGVDGNLPPSARAMPAAQWVGDAHLAGADAPTVAVMPFANLSGDPGQDYFVDGVVDDITHALSRVRGFSVIARSSTYAYKGRAADAVTVGRELGVRYLVEGSFRQAGDRLRIGVALIEASTGRQLWNNHYDGIREDVFDLQDKITAHVAAAVEPSLVSAEIERVRQRPTESLAAYELCLRAMVSATRSSSHDEVKRTLELLRRALEIDPAYSHAKALMAWAHAMAWTNRWVDRRSASAGLSLAHEALADSRNDPYTLAFAGHAIAVLGREFDQARHALSLAVALSPDSIYILGLAGWVFAYAGDSSTALRYLERAIRLDPLVARAGFSHSGVAYAHLIAGNAEEALPAARKGVLASPQFVPARLALLHALARTGHMDEAKALVAELLALMPRLTVSRYEATQLFADAGFRQRCSEDLRALGVPA